MSHPLWTQKGLSNHLSLKRHLRTNLTSAETNLWKRLRAKQLHGLKFRRQHRIGPYIVDFFCPSKCLIFEIDGDVHADLKIQKKDLTRERYLQSLGLRVIRYTNDDV